MKTPKAKARELVDMFSKWVEDDLYVEDGMGGITIQKGKMNAIECALICVDEIIKTCDEIVQSNDCAPYYCKNYWIEVRQEIEKI